MEDVGNGSVSLEIQMGSLERYVEILLMSIDGTATSPEHYESFSSVVSLTPGDSPGSTVSLTFQIVDNQSQVVRPVTDLAPPTTIVSFTVSASSMDPAVQLPDPNVTVNIWDVLD